MIGSWVSKTYRYSINPLVLKEVSPFASLVDKLLENGDLYIFEIGNHLPGYNIIMFYFAHSSADAVQYSVGSKSAGSVSTALASAFEELYQCYTFLYSSVFKPTNLENKPGAGYHLAFTSYNTQKTKLIIPFLEHINAFKIDTIADLNGLPTFGYQDMLQTLNELTPNVYFYYHYEKALELHFTKIFSLIFFPTCH